jgi:hypothetical protein
MPAPALTLKTATVCTSVCDWAFKLLAAAGLFSTSAAFFCVVHLRNGFADFAPRRWPDGCWLLAALISVAVGRQLHAVFGGLGRTRNPFQ